MASVPIVFTGDDWNELVTLKVDGVAYNFSTATEVSVALVSTDDDNATALIAATAQADSGDADWTNGIVACVFPRASTGISSYGRFYLEIQVTLGGAKRTWPRQAIEVRKGVVA